MERILLRTQITNLKLPIQAGLPSETFRCKIAEIIRPLIEDLVRSGRYYCSLIFKEIAAKIVFVTGNFLPSEGCAQ